MLDTPAPVIADLVPGSRTLTADSDRSAAALTKLHDDVGNKYFQAEVNTVSRTIERSDTVPAFSWLSSLFYDIYVAIAVGFSQQLTVTADTIASGVQKQAATFQSISATLEEITATARQNFASTREASRPASIALPVIACTGG
jgi:methyl-accepting chemotaxis protein